MRVTEDFESQATHICFTKQGGQDNEHNAFPVSPWALENEKLLLADIIGQAI